MDLEDDNLKETSDETAYNLMSRLTSGGEEVIEHEPLEIHPSRHRSIHNPARFSSVKLKKASVVKFPKRKPSLVPQEKKIEAVAADKTTGAASPCRNAPEVSHHFDPLTLYELAARVVDSLPPPEAFKWSQNNVVKWMTDVVGLPQYKECILRNHIDGSRLLWLENPSILPMLNIHDHEHIKTINKQVRKLYSVEYIWFCRSIGLPPRKPLTHCTWFMSRTGPSGGIRRNWTRCDILRWMKVINPAPVPRSHWDIVWQDKPEFPKTLFGKIPPAPMRERLPRYGSPVETGNEYQVPRKFCIDQNIANQAQLIWTDRKNETLAAKDVLNESKKHDDAKKFSPGLIPKPINLKGLTGRRLLLARRLLPKQKFFK